MTSLPAVGSKELTLGHRKPALSTSQVWGSFEFPGNQKAVVPDAFGAKIQAAHLLPFLTQGEILSGLLSKRISWLFSTFPLGPASFSAGC